MYVRFREKSNNHLILRNKYILIRNNANKEKMGFCLDLRTLKFVKHYSTQYIGKF
jgi:hypothetical protein